MARYLGIDLGSHTVKLAIFQGSGSRPSLADYRVRRVHPAPPDPDEDAPPGASQPSMDDRLAALHALLADELEEGAGRIIAAVGYPTQQASLRAVQLPFADKAQIEKTLPFEVEGLVPFDLEDMVLDSRVLSQDAQGSRVLTALADREQIAPLLDGLATAGTDPKYLIIDADMLGHYAPKQGVHAVVDLGHTRTLVTLVRDGRVIGARAIDHGGAELTAALADKLGITPDEAEGRKHVADLGVGLRLQAAAEWEEDTHTNPTSSPQSGGAVPPEQLAGLDEERTDPHAQIPLPEPMPISPAQLGDAPTHIRKKAAGGRDAVILQDALMPLISALRASLIGFEDNQTVEIDTVILCGGGSELGGLGEWLRQILGVPVEKARISDHASALGDPGRFALAHALGLLATGNTHGHELDLRKAAFAYKGDLAAYRNVALGLVAAMLAFVLAGTGLFALRLIQLNSQVGDVDEEISALALTTFPDVSPSLVATSGQAEAIMQERVAEVEATVQGLGALVDPRPPTLAMLHDVSTSVPPHSQARIDLAELNITPSSVTLKGATDSFEDVAEIEAALKKNSRFALAAKGDEKKKRDGIAFSVTIPLESGEEEDG